MIATLKRTFYSGYSLHYEILPTITTQPELPVHEHKKELHFAENYL